MQFAFFIQKTFKVFFGKLSVLSKTENGANSRVRGVRDQVLSVNMTQCVGKSICDSPIIC